MKLLKLKDVCSVNSGISPPKDKKIFENGTVPFYKTLDVGRIKTGNISDSELKVSQAFADSKKVFEPGTILFPKSGASTLLNHRVVIQKKGLVASTLAAIVPIKDLCLSKYLYYYLLTIDAKDFIPESFYPGMKISEISEIPIPVPSLNEQEKIVKRLEKVLQKIDKKIDLNLSKKIEIIEESILEKEFLKKEKFQRLENYIELVMGQAPPKSETNFSGIGTLFVKTGEFGDERPVSKEYTTKPLRLAQSTDVLISVVGATCGKINYGVDCAIGRSVAAIKPLSNLDQDYLYYLMKSYTKKLRKNSTGAAQTVINKDMINNVLIPDISKKEQVEAAKEIKFVLDKLKNLNRFQEKINEKLILLKKSILSSEFSYE